jgi:hypothetical protein
MDDKELFESAVSNEPAETPEVTEQPRDDKGRYAPVNPEPVAEAQPEPEPEVKPEPKPEPVNEALVPSWRLREVNEQREAAERRLNEMQAEMARRMAELAQPKREPAPKPDLYENPDAFVEYGVRQAVDPVRSEIGQLREFYSRRDAIRTHGEEKVKAAYDAVAQGLAQRDPEATAIYQRAMSSMDPFNDIVTWHQQKTVYSQIGSDPDAWFEKRHAEMLKDPAYQAKLLQQIQQSQSPTQKTNIIQLPPSLNKATGANVSDSDDTDMSDAALFKHAAAPRRR